MFDILIIIPVLSNFKGAVELISSIETRLGYKIYIHENYKHEDCVAKSWNAGMAKAKTMGVRYAAIINDDVKLSPFALDKMVTFLRENRRYGVVSPVDVAKNGESFAADYPEIIAPSGVADYSCFVISLAVYRDIGKFDENFQPAYFEDDDYDYRLKIHNYRSCSLSGVNMHHAGSQTQYGNGRGNPVVTPSQFAKNRSYYVEKWGGRPGHETRKLAFG